MKKLVYFLVFLFIGMSCFSQDIEKLPNQPWEELVEMNANKNYPIRKWGDSINISIEGLYNTSDSLEIVKIIKKLDSITETTAIRFVKTDDSNFRIKFLENYIRKKGRTVGAQTNHDVDGKIRDVELNIYRIEKNDLEVQNLLENQIAKMLISAQFAYPASLEKRESIFNNLKGPSLVGALNKGDVFIIQEVYKKGFKKRLKKAEQKFKNIPKKLENDKIKKRDRSLWWVKNPFAVLFLPVLILLLLFLFLIKKAKNSLDSIIKKDWLSFSVTSLVVLLLVGVLIIFSVSFFDFLTIPDDYSKVPYVRFDTIITTAYCLIALFPLLFLFRFLENKIQKSSQNIFIKTVLVFLSTGVLPFLCVLILFLFTVNGKGNIQGGYTTLSYVFLASMSIASFRALISYFIFKERSLIIENEKKLSNLRELKAKAELKSLQSQINPHFLYNSLNSIASLAPIDSAKTQKMAYSLSDLFKYSINRKGKKMSTVKDEIEMVKSYLDIEKIRFGDRLQFDIEADSTIENYEIPLFLIQPLVENAVKHGISQNEGNGKIVLKIEKNENELIISVSDNGPNFPEGLVSGHGLQTVYDLLRLSYGEDASLNWTNTPEKTITITIPETV